MVTTISHDLRPRIQRPRSWRPSSSSIGSGVVFRIAVAWQRMLVVVRSVDRDDPAGLGPLQVRIALARVDVELVWGAHAATTAAEPSDTIVPVRTLESERKKAASGGLWKDEGQRCVPRIWRRGPWEVGRRPGVRLSFGACKAQPYVRDVSSISARLVPCGNGNRCL